MANDRHCGVGLRSRLDASETAPLARGACSGIHALIMKLAILLAIFARVRGDERRELAGPAPGKETYDPRLATLREGRAGGSSSRAVTPPDVTRSLSRDREGAHTIATASTPRAAAVPEPGPHPARSEH